MAAYTENYNLILPEEDDFYNVEDFNENFRSVDTALSSVEDSLEDINATLNSMNQKLDQMAANPGGVIKSVQIIDVACNTAQENTLTYPINTVNPDKCIVLMNEMLNPDNNKPLISYTLSANSLVVGTTASLNAPCYLKFQIVEFY